MGQRSLYGYSRWHSVGLVDNYGWKLGPDLEVLRSRSVYWL